MNHTTQLCGSYSTQLYTTLHNGFAVYGPSEVIDARDWLVTRLTRSHGARVGHGQSQAGAPIGLINLTRLHGLSIRTASLTSANNPNTIMMPIDRYHKLTSTVCRYVNKVYWWVDQGGEKPPWVDCTYAHNSVQWCSQDFWRGGGGAKQGSEATERGKSVWLPLSR